MTTTSSTVTNFTTLEALHRIGKIEMQNDITYKMLPHFNFPRVQRKMQNVEKTQNSHELPNENRLMELLQQAQEKAYAELREFGIRNIAKDQFTCDFIYKPPIVSGEKQAL